MQSDFQILDFTLTILESVDDTTCRTPHHQLYKCRLHDNVIEFAPKRLVRYAGLELVTLFLPAFDGMSNHLRETHRFLGSKRPAVMLIYLIAITHYWAWIPN